MYVRQAKQFLRSAIEGFDERKYGFASVVDLLRAAGKEGVLRIERDRQGAIRLFPGANLAGRTSATSEPLQQSQMDIDETVDVEVPAERISDAGGGNGRSLPSSETRDDEMSGDDDRQPAFDMGPDADADADLDRERDSDADEPDEAESQIAFNIQSSDVPREPVKSGSGRKRKAPSRTAPSRTGRAAKTVKAAAPVARGRKTTRRKT